MVFLCVDLGQRFYAFILDVLLATILALFTFLREVALLAFLAEKAVRTIVGQFQAVLLFIF